MAEKRNPYHYDPEYYVHGSTARKLDVAQRTSSAQPTRRTGRERTGRTLYAEPARRSRTGYEVPAAPVYAEPARKPAGYGQPARKRMPEREPDRYERIRERENKREEKKLFHISRSIGFVGIVLLCGAMLCMGVLCVRYLDLRAESTRLDKTIAALRDDLSVLLDTNAGKEEALTENIDLESIYQTAVGEFGMIFPNHNEVIYYDMADLSYVRQYADIPETAMSILDKLLP